MAKTKRPPQTRKKLGGPRVGEGGPRRDKAEAVEDFSRRLSDKQTVLLTEYRGMTVTELAELRVALGEADADYKVFKNTLASIAARNLGFDGLTEHLTGPTAFTFPSGDAVVVAKKLSEFAKRVPTLVIKGGLLEGKVLGADDVNALAKLDSREVMLARTAGMFLSPIQQVANLFGAAFNQVGSLLVQLRDKLPAEGSASGTPDAAASDEAADAEPAETGEAAPEASAGEDQAAAQPSEAQPAEGATDQPAEQPDEQKQPDAGSETTQTDGTTEA